MTSVAINPWGGGGGGGGDIHMKRAKVANNLELYGSKRPCTPWQIYVLIATTCIHSCSHC